MPIFIVIPKLPALRRNCPIAGIADSLRQSGTGARRGVIGVVHPLSQGLFVHRPLSLAGHVRRIAFRVPGSGPNLKAPRGDEPSHNCALPRHLPAYTPRGSETAGRERPEGTPHMSKGVPAGRLRPLLRPRGPDAALGSHPVPLQPAPR
jgi:hypothetical protein